MPATYEPIATTTLGSAASTITFSSIPNTYTDLRVVLVATMTAGGYVPQLRLNNVSTGTLYSYTNMQGNGTIAYSNRQTNQNIFEWGDLGVDSTTIPFFATVDIFSYAGSTNKTCLFTLNNDNNGSGNVQYTVGLFRSTSAITEVNIRQLSTTYKAGTVATLYGIKAA